MGVRLVRRRVGGFPLIPGFHESLIAGALGIVWRFLRGLHRVQIPAELIRGPRGFAAPLFPGLTFAEAFFASGLELGFKFGVAPFLVGFAQLLLFGPYPFPVTVDGGLAPRHRKLFPLLELLIRHGSVLGPETRVVVGGDERQLLGDLRPSVGKRLKILTRSELAVAVAQYPLAAR